MANENANHQVKDADLPILGDIFFTVLIIWGGFFTLNLLIAVLERKVTEGKVRRSWLRRLYLPNIYVALAVQMFTGIVWL